MGPTSPLLHHPVRPGRLPVRHSIHLRNAATTARGRGAAWKPRWLPRPDRPAGLFLRPKQHSQSLWRGLWRRRHAGRSRARLRWSGGWLWRAVRPGNPGAGVGGEQRNPPNPALRPYGSPYGPSGGSWYQQPAEPGQRPPNPALGWYGSPFGPEARYGPPANIYGQGNNGSSLGYNYNSGTGTGNKEGAAGKESFPVHPCAAARGTSSCLARNTEASGAR